MARRYDYGFGANPAHPTDFDMAASLAFCGVLQDLGINLLNVTAGSPYYNPHVTQPALYPPSDGYRPPEEPLVGRSAHARGDPADQGALPRHRLRRQRLHLSAGIPPARGAGRGCVPGGRISSGSAAWFCLTRKLPRDVLRDGTMKKKRLCRTFSDCTTAPRNGMVSGCYPLDLLYKRSPEAKTLAEVKKAAKLA